MLSNKYIKNKTIKIWGATSLLNLLDVLVIGFNEFCGESSDWVQ
jgi:hypothetical protein